MNQEKTLEEIRRELSNKMQQISNGNHTQFERAQLIYSALEVYRKSFNQIARLQREADRKRGQAIIDKYKAEKKAIELETNKNILQTTAGTELFSKFVEKFVKEHKK